MPCESERPSVLGGGVSHPVFRIGAPVPDLAHLVFEYHPRAGKVYVINTSLLVGESHVAQVIAEHCDTDGRAFGFVQTWCRGYRAGRAALPEVTGRPAPAGTTPADEER